MVSARVKVIDKNWFDRFLYFQRLLDLLKSVEGDVVECGVASGNSLAMLASGVRSSGINRHIWGFDSWEGLPEPSSEDLATKENIAKKGDFNESSMEIVLATLRFYGFDDSEISSMVTLVKGLLSDTLPNYKDPHIALLHIDTDLYDPHRDALRYLWPKISVGGIAAFDDYQEPLMWPGARKAVDEFLSELPAASVRLEKDTLHGKYYAVKLA